MHARRKRLVTWSWIALFAMFFGALAPTLSRAMAPRLAGEYLIEVCSANGSRWIGLSASEAEQYPDPVLAGGGAGSPYLDLDHCPYCCSPGGGLGLLPVEAQVFVLPAGSGFAPAIAVSAPRRPPAWLTARPRAPPSPA